MDSWWEHFCNSLVSFLKICLAFALCCAYFQDWSAEEPLKTLEIPETVFLHVRKLASYNIMKTYVTGSSKEKTSILVKQLINSLWRKEKEGRGVKLQ